MVRSLWTAATGMNAQQTNVDTIANNLANVNTNGYKTQAAQFKSLLYQTLQTATTTADGNPKPTSSQVGLGVRTSSINSIFTQGSLLESASDTAFAIEGDGFFAIRTASGDTEYTRNGDFNFSLYGNGQMALCTSSGEPVLDTKGNPIILRSDMQASSISVDGDGNLLYPDENNNPQPIGMQIGLYQFSNPEGLEKLNDSRYKVSAASGNAINESTANGIQKSSIRQGYLEGSNVQLADEMVNLIVAQRAYEANSKIITTSDTMMEQANQLKR